MSRTLKQVNVRRALLVHAAVSGCLLTSAYAAEPEAAPVATAAPEVAPGITPLSLDYFRSLPTAETLTGDWGGVRTQMAAKGLTADMTLTQVGQGVVSGGLDSGWTYNGRGNITINLDTQKMGLWPGGFFMMEAEGNFGKDLSSKSGLILPANVNELFPLPNGGGGFSLPALNFMQFLSPNIGFVMGKLDTIATGDMNVFAHGKGNEGFLNTSFNFNPILAVTAPYSTLGAGMILLPTGDPKEFIITLSVIDTEGKPDTSGFNTVFKGGTTYAGEGRYTTHFFGLTGHQLVGGTYSDKLYLDLDQSLANLIIPRLPIERASGSWSGYYNFDQYLYQPDPKTDQGFGVFGRFGVSDGQANPIHFFVSGGIGGKGVIPSRTQDRFGVGYFYLAASDGNIPERLNFGDSQGFEAYYEIALTPWMHLTPDVQVVQPSQHNVDTATILGVRLELKF